MTYISPNTFFESINIIKINSLRYRMSTSISEFMGKPVRQATSSELGEFSHPSGREANHAKAREMKLLYILIL